MTIIEFNHYQCAVCGAVSQHDDLISTHSFGNTGWSDLDLRPSRTSNSLWSNSDFQTCPECGYVAKNIEIDIPDEIKSFVLSDEYKKLDPHTSAGQYAALLALSLKKKDYSSALTACRHLAWIYDDRIQYLEGEIARGIKYGDSAETLAPTIEKQRQARVNAPLYRRKALEILETHENELRLDFDVMTCLTADLYRRCGDFEKVIQFCSKNGSSDENIRDILRFEVYLSSQKDAACHNIGEAKTYCAEHREEEISLPDGTSVTIPKKGKSWTCAVCGAEGNTGSCCPKCGSLGWRCPSCGHKWNTGDVCDNCKTPKPVNPINKTKKRWSCPKCQHSGNAGKICRHCGAPKPQLQTWDCPHCGQKENTHEECEKCGFSYWDIHDPAAVCFYDTMLFQKLLDERKKKEKQ